MPIEKKRKRRLLGAADVRNTAMMSGGGKRYLKLPANVGTWEPDKAGEHDLDVMAYEIKSERHPDRVGEKCRPGDAWYRYPYKLHTRVGPQKEDIVCPGTWGRPCPICEERMELERDYEANKEAIKSCKAKDFALYLLKDPKRAGSYNVFAYSSFKFSDQLDVEIGRTNESNMGFYRPDIGRTLHVWFKEEKMGAFPYLKADRIDFVKRPKMDVDEVLDNAPCLDDVLIEESYKSIKKKHRQAPSEGDTDDAQENGSMAKNSTKSKKSTVADDDDEDADTATFSAGDSVQFKLKKKVITGEVIDVDGEDVTVKTDDGEEYDVDASDLEAGPAKKKGKSSKATDPDDDGEVSGTDPDFATGVSVTDADGKTGIIKKIGKGKDKDAIGYEVKGKLKWADIADLTVVADDDDEDADDADTEDDDDSDAEPFSPTVGDEVQFTDEEGETVTGVVKKIGKNDDVTIKTADGTKVTVDLDDLKPVDDADDEDPEEEDDDGEDADSDDDDSDDADTEDDDDSDDDDEAETFEVGDKVTWEDGDESGKVIKVKGDRVKVKGDDGAEWLDASDVSHAKAKSTKPAKGKKK